MADRPATRMPRPARWLCLAGLCPENHGAALARVTVMPRPTACTASSVAVTSPSELQILGRYAARALFTEAWAQPTFGAERSRLARQGPPSIIGAEHQ